MSVYSIVIDVLNDRKPVSRRDAGFIGLRRLPIIDML